LDKIKKKKKERKKREEANTCAQAKGEVLLVLAEPKLPLEALEQFSVVNVTHDARGGFATVRITKELCQFLQNTPEEKNHHRNAAETKEKKKPYPRRTVSDVE
jgi:hypothetical protein